MNSKYDFLTKDVVDTFYWSTASKDRSGAIQYSENGRTYAKFGTYQAFTFAGIVYKVFDKNANSYKYVMVIGVSKQHPCDVKIDKRLAYEIAYENALDDPITTVVSPAGKFNKGDFMTFVEWYFTNSRIELIKTKEEIEAEGKCPKNYNR